MESTGTTPQRGTILVVNTGSITTKFAVYVDGACVLEQKLEHSVAELSRFADVMDQDGMRTDAIISALGADCIRPSFPGIDGPKVLMAEDAHRCEFEGERVAVIGGGLVGIEAALHLAKRGKRVTIVEFLPEIANDANIRYGRTYRWELEKERVEVLTSTKCNAITEEGISAARADGTVVEISADAVVIAVGMRSRESESESLRNCAETFIPIGNCVAPGQVQQAIRAGYDAATFQI